MLVDQQTGQWGCVGFQTILHANNTFHKSSIIYKTVDTTIPHEWKHANNLKSSSIQPKSNVKGNDNHTD